jgi:hypothetical protein
MSIEVDLPGVVRSYKTRRGELIKDEQSDY